MITLKLKYFTGEETNEVITQTVFSDNTSQVYKIESITKDYRNVVKAEIVWQFENEQEIVTVAQLADLLEAYTKEPRPVKVLNIPFLPYGRADKPISNQTTFGERTFGKLINTMNFDRVISFDVHGITTVKNLQPLSANETIKKVFEENGYEVYCYPDGRACERYLLEPSVNGVKYRDKTTGKVIDYQLITEYDDVEGRTHGVNIKGKKILIVTDILDVGGTFVELMELMKRHEVGEVGLYSSHAIASKGYDHLKEAGISQFFTTNSLIKNPEGIKIV